MPEGHRPALDDGDRVAAALARDADEGRLTGLGSRGLADPSEAWLASRSAGDRLARPCTRWRGRQGTLCRPPWGGIRQTPRVV